MKAYYLTMGDNNKDYILCIDDKAYNKYNSIDDIIKEIDESLPYKVIDLNVEIPDNSGMCTFYTEGKSYLGVFDDKYDLLSTVLNNKINRYEIPVDDDDVFIDAILIIDEDGIR